MAILQKRFTTDYLTKKRKKNEGELSQYKVEGSHPAIIPEETWELVQLEIERRSRIGTRYSSAGALSSRLVCADCGGFYGSKIWHSNSKNRSVIWRCNNKYRDVQRKSGQKKWCTRHVTEKDIMAAFKAVVGQLYERRSEVIAACETVLAELMDTSILDAKLEKARSDAETIAAEVKALVGKDAGDTFKERYAALEKRYITIQKKIQTLEANRDEQLYRARKAKAFLKTMDNTDDLSDEELFIALVDKVVVGEKLTFVLRDGSEW